MTDITEILKKILTSVYGKDMRQAIHDGIKACKDAVDAGLGELKATDIVFETEEGYYWDVLTWSVNGQAKRSIHKKQVDEEINTYLQNVVLPVSPGEKYRIECAKFKPGQPGANVINYPIIAVEQADRESASGYCGSMSKATDGIAIYDYVVPENANYLIVSHVQQPSSMDIVFSITQLFDTAKEYIQNIAGAPEEYQKKLDNAVKEYDKKLNDALTEYDNRLSIGIQTQQTVDFQAEQGSYWYVNLNRTITKYGPGSQYMFYASTVIPVTEGEVYEVHCAKSADSYYVPGPVIAVSNATNSEADGVIAIFENPTDGSNQYVLTVPTGAKFLLINHVVKSYSGIDMEIYKRNSLEDLVMGTVKDMFSATAAHNTIYRGKYLGDTVTAEQAAAIADGSFEDLFIGDYWTMGGVNYRIADFDYWYRTGFPEAIRVEKHHAVIVPDTAIATGQMNGGNTTSGGYRASLMKSKMNDTTSALPQGMRSRLLVHNALLDGTWTETSVDLMNEIMVYGCYILADNSNKQTSENRQLSLFRMSPQARYAGDNYWLRNYANATEFTLVSYYGDASKDVATSTYGIRPVFAITGD